MTDYKLIYKIESLELEQALVGVDDYNIKIIEEKFKVELKVLNGEISINAIHYNERIVKLIVCILKAIELLLENKILLNDADLHSLINNIDEENYKSVVSLYLNKEVLFNTQSGKSIYPKTLNQRIYLKALEENDIVFALGPAGTGKTYSTAEYAQAIITGISLKEFRAANTDRKTIMKSYNELVKKGQIVFTTFHQSYGYEEFIQGLRPDTTSEKMNFKTVDGVFKRIADRALNDLENNYVIVIDEINRANISKVFGELITLIEEDKRWGEINQTSATLQSGDVFAVPNNLYIVGTMNSADKSISLIDAALRRRFEFIEQKPDASLVTDPDMRKVLEKLNELLADQLDSADLLIGHSYFMGKTKEDLPKVLNNSIIPLLYEYFYDNKKKVLGVLNNAIEPVDYVIEDDRLGRIFVERQKN